MEQPMERVVIVGASLAGARAGEALRKRGFEGSLTLVGAEPHLPYDRPPLSKEVLLGEAQPADAILAGAEHWRDLSVDLVLGNPAIRLHPAARTVELQDGSLPYDGLIVATGAHPRRLPQGHEIDGVHVLRTLDDATVLRDALAQRPRVVIVGAGFIGAEAASAARRHGCEVTVVEALPAPLTRGLGPVVGEACGRLHGDHGTVLRVGVGVESLDAGAHGVTAARLTDGAVVDTDLVLVGIGAVPTTGWLEGSGLTLRDGLVCDATLAAGPPGVYAAGDCARWPNSWSGLEMRLEHWTNAAEQGAAAAANLLAGPEGATPFAPVPYVWSDQYGTRIQVAGHVGPDDEPEVLLGSVEERSFLAAYRRGDRFVAVAALGLIRPFVKLRIVLGQGGSWDDAVAMAESLR
jgi:NADPH-dependent 2,4-dienoyl-CoA reductase/sulfur reductase-like enzyme